MKANGSPHDPLFLQFSSEETDKNVRTHGSKVHRLQIWPLHVVFSRALLLARSDSSYLSLCDVVRLLVCLSVRGRTTFTFYAFLDVSCHPECSKKCSPQFFFHPKLFWVKQGATQCCQALLVLSAENLSSFWVSVL